MNHASDLEAAQKPPAQLIDALWAVEPSQTSPVIQLPQQSPALVDQEVLLIDGPSSTWVYFIRHRGACQALAQATVSCGYSSCRSFLLP